jgi:hypothetical protein
METPFARRFAGHLNGTPLDLIVSRAAPAKEELLTRGFH